MRRLSSANRAQRLLNCSHVAHTWCQRPTVRVKDGVERRGMIMHKQRHMHGASGFGKGTQLQHIGCSRGEAREKSLVASLCISLNVRAGSEGLRHWQGLTQSCHSVSRPLAEHQCSRGVHTCDDKRSRASVSLAATGPASDWHSHRGCHGIWDTSNPEKKDVGAPGPNAQGLTPTSRWPCTDNLTSAHLKALSP